VPSRLVLVNAYGAVQGKSAQSSGQSINQNYSSTTVDPFDVKNIHSHPEINQIPIQTI
jgi:hypothetical protein